VVAQVPSSHSDAKGHLLRRIIIFVTSVLGELHEQLGPFYSDIGRPSNVGALRDICRGRESQSAQRCRMYFLTLWAPTSAA